MYEGAGGISPVFQLCINGTAVTVMFSESGMPDVKTKVRDMRNVSGRKCRGMHVNSHKKEHTGIFKAAHCGDVPLCV